MSEEIKSCPLCASPSWFGFQEHGNSIRCGSCGLQLFGHAGDRESLVKLWNTRAAPAVDDAMISEIGMRAALIAALGQVDK